MTNAWGDWSDGGLRSSWSVYLEILCVVDIAGVDFRSRTETNARMLGAVFKP